MGAYKNYKAETERAALKNLGVNYALLEAGVEVVKSAKTPDGSIDAKKLEEMKEKPEKYAGAFTSRMNRYVQQSLKIEDKIWAGIPEESKSRLLKIFGITDNIIRYLISHIIPSDKLMNFAEVLQKDKNFESYRRTQDEDLASAQENLRRGYHSNMLGTVKEALEELNLTKVIDPRAVGFEDLLEILPKFQQLKEGQLEEIIEKIEPRLLRKAA